MGRLFGTDGARGIAITELSIELAVQIGRAAAIVLTRATKHKPKIFIGKDTRLSSDVLEAALAAGICSVGADAHILGVVPTPAVAILIKKYSADAGVMISASHNSMEYNGIKLFSSTGFKLSDELEAEIESLILDNPTEIKLACGEAVGRITYVKNAEWDYVRYVMKNIEGDMGGLRVAIDCANGSASFTAEKLFKGLGASCYFISNIPDGCNINKECGSTNLDALKRCVIDNKCHIGLAFDGDADRCLAVDELGNTVDGDKLIAIFAQYMRKTGKLKHNAAVVTIMSNLGFFRFAKENNIVVATTAVGDRYVLEEMLRGGYNLGGEQSGHIIFLDEATTGDGQLTGAKLLHILSHTTLTMSQLSQIMETYPQVLVNVKIKPEQRGSWNDDIAVTEAIAFCEEKLGGDGRILVRESGTEPLVRVMLEGRQYGQIVQYANTIARVIRERCPE
ncbi:MAG: phosphoglucosamine mutase [Oscillospiraceae bacterium]|jgi:phosphoglucosamine mutase